MRSSDSPAAPKLPSIPARLIASTISTEPMPLAIAPVMYGVLQAVVAEERGVAELLGAKRRQVGHHWQCTSRSRTDGDAAALRDRQSVLHADDRDRRPEIGQGRTKIGRALAAGVGSGGTQ